jgi:dihydroorotase
MYTAHAAIELYTEVFDGAGALARLDGFASAHGADFYGLPRNESSVTLTKLSWEVPESLPFGDDVVVPFRAGEQVPWSLAD